MSLKRGSVLGVLVLCLLLVGTVEAQEQERGLRAQVTAMQAQLDQALAAIAELQAALNAERSEGVTQAVLDAAIAAEAGARSAGDAALEGQIANEAAAREAADATLTAFDATLAPLTSLAPLASYVTVATGDINDLAGPHVIFSGANVHVRSGHGSEDSYTENGKGNLVLGYNEPSDASLPVERGGSHNLVIGPNHRYNFGVGLIAGGSHRLGGDGASVSGGLSNTAGGIFSSVGAGLRNDASGDFSSVSGGADNIASGSGATVGAGQMNQATGDLSSVSGGSNNTAGAVLATVGGGTNQTNTTGFTFVP